MRATRVLIHGWLVPGEALYRFLLSHAETPPTFYVHLRGTHTESRTRTVSRRDDDGHHRTHHEHYTEEVIGASSCIDAAYVQYTDYP